MNRKSTVALWVIADILILICGTIAGYVYITYRLDQAWGPGRPMWTNDFIIEPLGKGFFVLLLLVIGVNTLAAIVYRIMRHRKAKVAEKQKNTRKMQKKRKRSKITAEDAK